MRIQDLITRKTYPTKKNHRNWFNMTKRNETLITNVLLFTLAFFQWTDSANVFTTLLLPNSSYVLVHLRGYNCSVCTYSHAISCV